VKDSIPTAGIRTTYGSLLFAEHVPSWDATAVARLRAAGALVVGKTNVPEFMLMSRSSNRLGRECVNPWDSARTCGGSSGGSGAAVAVGIVPVALGGDDGGSVRLPAAMKGVFGICPSHGRVPRADLLSGDLFLGFPQESIGPLTRDVRDAATVLRVTAGWDASDPFAMRVPVPDLEAELDRGVEGLRAEWVTGRIAGVEDATLAVVRASGESLLDLGVRLTDGGELPAMPLDAVASEMRFVGDFLRAICADPDRRAVLGPLALSMAATPPPSPRNELEGSRQRAAYLAELAHRFERSDVLLTPTMGFPAPVRPEDPFAWPRPVSEMAGATSMVNVAGISAASVPAGLVDGMPVGLQVIGRRGDEATVLRVCRAVEHVRPWVQLHPPL
jgi:Asp-tRNA(Asn)/Glu-tRNA(Gln) amidotransferase A subunit family amidase